MIGRCDHHHFLMDQGSKLDIRFIFYIGTKGDIVLLLFLSFNDLRSVELMEIKIHMLVLLLA